MKPPFHKAGAPALATTISSLVRTSAIPAAVGSRAGCAHKVHSARTSPMTT